MLEKIDIYEMMLKTIFKCGDLTLNKIFKLLRNTHTVYGVEVFNEVLTYFTRDYARPGEDEGKFITGAYIDALLPIFSHLFNIKELEFSTCDAIFEKNYNDPNVRFKVENFEEELMSFKKKTQVTQEINDFLASLNG